MMEFISTFSQSWREFIKIFLSSENLTAIPERRWEIKCACLETPPLQHDWCSLVDELINEVPITILNQIVYKERIMCMSSIACRNLLKFIFSSAIDYDSLTKLISFLVCKMDEFDPWCKWVILKSFTDHFNKNREHHDHNSEWSTSTESCSASFSQCYKNLCFLTDAGKGYFSLLKDDFDRSGLHWAFDNDFAYNENGYISDVRRHVQDEGRIINIFSNQNQCQEKEVLEMKELALSVYKEYETPLKKPKIILKPYELIPSSSLNNISENSKNEAGNKYHKTKMISKPCQFKLLIDRQKDFKQISSQLNAIITKPLTELEDACNGLEIEPFTEDNLLYFMKLICSEEISMSSTVKVFLLKRSFLNFMLGLERATTRQVYNCFIECMDVCRNECINAVIVPLIMLSNGKSLQEDFVLKVLKSSCFTDKNYYQILQSILDVCRKEQRVSGSFIKFLEIFFTKKITVPVTVLSDVVDVLEGNATQFKDSIEIPKLVMTFIKLNVNNIHGVVEKLKLLLHSNRTFLKKTALKELSKIYI